MRIINAEILVSSGDIFPSTELFGCNIQCEFPLFSKDYEPPKLFEIRGFFDGKSEDFKSVFENVDILNCIIKGTDCA